MMPLSPASAPTKPPTTNHPPSTYSSSSPHPTASSSSAGGHHHHHHHSHNPHFFISPSTNLSHTDLWLAASHQLSQIEAGSALDEETPLFGPAHAKALEELRTAQLQLAQAWMRSECEDLLDGEHAELAKRSFGRDRFGGGEASVAAGGESGRGGGGGAANTAGGEIYNNGSERGGSSGTAGGVGGSTTEGGATIGGGGGGGARGGGVGGVGGGTGAATATAATAGGIGELPIPGSAAGAAVHGLGGFGGTSFGSSASSLRCEGGGDSGIEKDTLLARKRRELNYAHFDRVSRSVVDVIQKLESVAGAMGVVETKSREIWGSEASDNSSSKWGPERPR